MVHNRMAHYRMVHDIMVPNLMAHYRMVHNRMAHYRMVHDIMVPDIMANSRMTHCRKAHYNTFIMWTRQHYSRRHVVTHMRSKLQARIEKNNSVKNLHRLWLDIYVGNILHVMFRYFIDTQAGVVLVERSLLHKNEANNVLHVILYGNTDIVYRVPYRDVYRSGPI